jgi:transaldolase
VACLERLRQGIQDCFKPAHDRLQVRYLRFLAEVTLSLRSFLPRWNLRNADRHAEAALAQHHIQAQADASYRLAAELAAQAPATTAELLAEWRAENAARLRAEQAAHPETEAESLVGGSVGEYVTHLSAQIASSHLRRIAEMRLAGETLTEVSNDYAAFLPYAMYLGASFATINPPLVHNAWLADPQRWDPVVDRIIAENPQADEDGLARLVTLEVVLANMRLLRPVFLLSEGRMGCVCLQVNPRQHGNAAVMTSDALSIYEALRAKLDGGAPNVVFKLPGTRAGLETCRALTQRGIGVTITVDFGMFQHLPFAQAIRDGQSIFSCLVEMSGRLAYPVRDELLARLDELAAYGIGEAQAREAAAWSGIAVLKRLYRLLSARGYDLDRVKPLVASLRIYAGQDYATLPNAFPDITEVLGASIISVFPNVRRPFDAQPELQLAPRRIESPVPEDILERLSHSQIFRQAYYVADRDWLPEGDDRFRPDHELTLEDEAATAGWAPVRNTLAEFCNSYDAFVGRILERKRTLDTQ